MTHVLRCWTHDNLLSAMQLYKQIIQPQTTIQLQTLSQEECPLQGQSCRPKQEETYIAVEASITEGYRCEDNRLEEKID